MDRRVGAPWHLWVVGVVTLLWNAIGAADFVFSNLRSPFWFEAMQYPPAGIAYLDAFPFWARLAWGMGTIGGFLGSLLLLFRSRLAVIAFALSLVGILLTTIYEAGAVMPPELEALQPAWFPILLWSVAVFLLIYSWSMRRKGVLR
jgi:hypothetical protein